LSTESAALVWEDVSYQQSAGFGRFVSEQELFADGGPSSLKLSRVAVVPQTDRRGRIILNLSSEVPLPARRELGKRRKRKRVHPSVNETSVPAEDQSAVKALGTAMHAILLFSFSTDCTWEIEWQKIDLSDGFWRMIVGTDMEYSFVYQMPQREGDPVRHYFVPSALQMGWMNSPAYFCSVTEAVRLLFKQILALTSGTGITVPHRHETKCVRAPMQ
jgi:hypothetical protein